MFVDDPNGRFISRDANGNLKRVEHVVVFPVSWLAVGLGFFFVWFLMGFPV